jgi:hypothetical protein
VSDSLKLVASQTLLVHVTTYMRRRLAVGTYPNLDIRHVLGALRVSLDLLMMQGEGPAEPLPALSELRRANELGKRFGQGRVRWGYGFLRTTLRQLVENLFFVLYHVVGNRHDKGPEVFPVMQVRQELDRLLSAHMGWVEEQARHPQMLHLKALVEGILDKCRI